MKTSLALGVSSATRAATCGRHACTGHASKTIHCSQALHQAACLAADQEGMVLQVSKRSVGLAC
eukprot:360339-Chlamydomonas_euryale.AAC.11